MREQQLGMEKQMVSVLKNKEGLVRDMADKKKCVILFGIREEIIPVRTEREQYEKNKIMRVLDVLEAEWVKDEVVEYTRLGKYSEGKDRPLKLKLNSQAAAEEMLHKSWKLKECTELKKVFIRRNMSEEEREKLKELLAEARERNEERSEEEREQFFWRIRNERMIKWWIRDSRGEQRRNQ